MVIEQGADFYAILGVPPRASAAEMALAYRALLHRHHPDKGVDASVDRTIAVVRAYAVLRDPERRARYDRERLMRWAARRTAADVLLIATERHADVPRASPMRSVASTGLIALYALALCLGTACALVVLQHIERAAVPAVAGHPHVAVTDVDGDAASAAF